MINLVKRIPYWQLIAIPILLMSAGVASNQLVLIANHDKFPVMVNSAKLEEFTEVPCEKDDDDSFFPFAFNSEFKKKVCHEDINQDGMIDDVHCVMVPSSHLKALSDIFDLGSIYSVGDFMLMAGEWLGSFTPIMWLALVLRKLMA